jgi:hypothetical protein
MKNVKFIYKKDLNLNSGLDNVAKKVTPKNLNDKNPL